jgi:hypothetical protein
MSKDTDVLTIVLNWVSENPKISIPTILILAVVICLIVNKVMNLTNVTVTEKGVSLTNSTGGTNIRLEGIRSRRGGVKVTNNGPGEFKVVGKEIDAKDDVSVTNADHNTKCLIA